MSLFKKRAKTDWTLFSAIILLTLLGLVFIYAASSYTAEKTYGNPFFFVVKQAFGAAVGLVGMFFAMKIDLNRIRKLAFPLLMVTYVLLALVFVPGIGVENYGARRWIGFLGQSFQPSELGKFSLVLFAAVYLSRGGFEGRNILSYLPVLAAGGIICILIILEPNMSVAVCVGTITLALLFIGGFPPKAFLALLAVAAAAVPLLIIVEPYRLLRLMAFLDPFASPREEGYQLIQSLYALGSGGWFGVGLFNSRQKYRFLPFAESDFIFSVIGEEIGLVGALLVLSVYAFIVCKGAKAAISAENRFKSILAGGITLVIGVQTAINVAVVSGCIPPTGIPLPFISSGGSSLAVFMTAAGALINISGESRIRSRRAGGKNRGLFGNISGNMS